MTPESMRRWNIGRDVAAGVLVCAALLLPWNLYSGIAIPGNRTRVSAVLALATLLSLGSITATYAGRWRIFGAHFHPVLVGRLRLGLNVPYLLLVLGFVAFDVVQTIRHGGSAQVPGGVGPGAWLGTAGALLAAQPVTIGGADGGRFRRWLHAARILGYASIVGAGLSVLDNLYWRGRYAMTGLDDGTGFGRQNIAIIATAVVYGAVAWVTVFVASRWIVQHSKASRLATVMLGASTLVAGLLVWGLPIGRIVDGFHGIAQNTSTAGVGFEGYLAWAAGAAVFAVPTLHSVLAAPSTDTGVWLSATRKVLLLIVVWCAGSVLMRLTDLAVAIILDLPYSPYDSAAMAAFDLVTAAVAVWLRINLGNRSFAPAVLWSMSAVVFGLAISRIVVGAGLAPRFADSRGATLFGPVYGNDLAQQITSTFDVVLCGLALCSLVVAIVAVPRSGAAPVTPPASGAAQPPHAPRIFRPEAETQQLSTDAPRIYRTEDDSTHHGRHEA